MMQLRLFVTVATAFGSLAAVAACSSDSGLFGDGTTTTTTTTTTSQGGTGGSSQGGSSQGGSSQGGSAQGGFGGGSCAPLGDPCTACLYASCHTTYCSCSADAACTSISACAFGCPPNDQACLDGCFGADPGGMAEFILGADCAGIHCANACPGTAPVAQCQLCTANECETQLEACYANPECIALVNCALQCSPNDQQCIFQCGFAHQSGIQAGQALQNCTTQNCPSC